MNELKNSFSSFLLLQQQRGIDDEFTSPALMDGCLLLLRSRQGNGLALDLDLIGRARGKRVEGKGKVGERVGSGKRGRGKESGKRELTPRFDG